MSESEIKPSTASNLFKDIQADDAESEIALIESLCMRCGENGNTKLLLTKIPFYKEVVVMSFSCPHCNWENNELQQAAKIQEEGVKYELLITCQKDLSRQIVKTEWATLKIPELEFEIPARTQDGSITTIEGIINRTVEGLNQKLEIQKLEDGETEYSDVLKEFISHFESLKLGTKKFTFILEDPSGNSFVENLLAPLKDPHLIVSHYKRTEIENKLLGISESVVQEPEQNNEENLNEEVLSFNTNCPNCNAPAETKMKVTQIPNFKEAIIMATNCSACGHRTNEVKSGGGVEPLGKRITLNLENPKDLTRDVLKSETCSISIPELELEVGSYALGGRFTTIEGLLVNFKEQLSSQNLLIQGDSADEENVKRMDDFLAKIDNIINGKMKVTVVLNDPCGNSYIENLYTPDADPQLNYVEYERTSEQNGELGFADMKTENYSTDLSI